MNEVFEISGYYKDDKAEFEGYLVCAYDQTPKGYEDDDIFYYGLSESEIKSILEEEDNGILDFVITSYKRVEEIG